MLRMYRDEEHPDIGLFGDKGMTTLSKDDILAALKDKYSLDGLEVCRLGGIDPRREELCKLLHFAGEVGACGEGQTSQGSAEGHGHEVADAPGGGPTKKLKTDNKASKVSFD